MSTGRKLTLCTAATFSVLSVINASVYGDASIRLDKTVRICVADSDDPVDPQCANICGSATSLVCEPGTVVRFCYRVTNNGTVTLSSHDLEDSEFGPLLANEAIGLSPGSSIFVTHKEVITGDVTNTATWTATNGDVTVEDSDSVTVRIDSDGDGIPDEDDTCPNGDDNNHSDNDDFCDACDNCPGVTNPGQEDSDGDGIGDACDECPNDPLHSEAGTCICADILTDDDGDGTPNCQDGCPDDDTKQSHGECGCGDPDDTDNDGVPDCDDRCPLDPNKVVPQKCGCGNSEADSDEDGTPNCEDDCPVDAGKTEPGICGCDIPDRDSDADHVPDCDDNCAILANPDQKDSDGDGVGDVCAEAFENFCGNCGSGGATMAPLALMSLVALKVSRRRRK